MRWIRYLIALAALLPCWVAAGPYVYARFNLPWPDTWIGTCTPEPPAEDGTCYDFYINDSGDIAGSFWDEEDKRKGFVRSPDGVFKRISIAGAAHMFVTGINNNREVGMFSCITDCQSTRTFYVYRTVIRSTGGLVSRLVNLGNVPGPHWRPLGGPNNDRVFVGDIHYPGSGAWAGFSYAPETDQEHIFQAPVGVATHATGINDAGTIVGYNQNGGFRQGNWFKAINYPNAGWTSPAGISSNGNIAGVFLHDNGYPRGFVLSSAGYQAIEFPSELGATWVYSVNAEGRVTGKCMDCMDSSYTNFVAAPLEACCASNLDLNYRNVGTDGARLSLRFVAKGNAGITALMFSNSARQIDRIVDFKTTDPRFRLWQTRHGFGAMSETGLAAGEAVEVSFTLKGRGMDKLTRSSFYDRLGLLARNASPVIGNADDDH